MTNADDVADKEWAFRRDLGQRIVEIRRRQGLSQATLARRLGVVSCRVSHWERGFHPPSLVQVVQIALALQVGLDELVLGKAPAATGVRGLTPMQCEQLALSLRNAMEALRGQAPRARRTPDARPEISQEGSISPRRSR
jgi:transcriptional regulator with XRE-family HTH domain